jgi:hypothetical protein
VIADMNRLSEEGDGSYREPVRSRAMVRLLTGICQNDTFQGTT